MSLPKYLKTKKHKESTKDIHLHPNTIMEASSKYPCPSKEELVKEYVGKSLHDVSGPAVVFDVSKIKKNCESMLNAMENMKLGFRAHIKTHKTTELTRFQVGDGSGPINLIVSTIIEAENLVPLLLEYKSGGREINVLYSFPVTAGAVDRLSAISQALGPKALSLMIDHPSQLRSVSAIHTKSGQVPLVYLKIDMGGHRAGVIPGTEACTQLISSALGLANEGNCILHGLYSHAGHSYSSNSKTAALDYLRQEFEALLVTAEAVHSAAATKIPLVLSVGATPTTSSIRNILLSATSTEESNEVSALKATIDTIRKAGCEIEMHAGVYPVLDLQQLATHALPENMLTWSSIAITILAEVASIYPSRGTSPEALLTAGSLALGREPCKAYPGWGILTPWNRSSFALPNTGPENFSGWQVARISQEHGIITNPGRNDSELSVGQKVRIWPNHACIAGAGFGWYLIVDESREGKEDEIVDVWVRWRGW